uniref:EB domain-containing protein n=1 Tax=Magallana gigas TaxID=29159 RepID=A0A8W8LLA2_MAGGI|nr:uncharacterized protein LOC105331977 isoform X2 [Crassostrea gigas]
MSTFVYIYIIIVLIKRYSADEITRNVCFKTASELVKNLNKCRFSLKSVVDLMQDNGFEVWHTQDCRKKDAQCIQLNSACICQCLSGYSKVKGICSINVPISNQTRDNVEN